MSRELNSNRAPNDSEKSRSTGVPVKDAKSSSGLSSTHSTKSTKVSSSEMQEPTTNPKVVHDNVNDKDTPVDVSTSTQNGTKEATHVREKDDEATLQKAEEERKEAQRVEDLRIAREQAAREEEALKEKEEAEKLERQRIEEAEARSRAAEAQRALFLEQERVKREEQEKRRAIALEQARAEKARLEKLKREEHLAKLPYLLRWLELVDEPKTVEIARLFKSIPGYRYDTIKPELSENSSGREPWMLNTHVALLLGERDLQLSRCKRPKASDPIILTHSRYRLGTSSTNTSYEAWCLGDPERLVHPAQLFASSQSAKLFSKPRPISI
jgi:hypothetical protein